jgi:ABC-type microcin C transport system permease subunit YejB
MLLYNVTFGIDKAIETEWILWMKENYLAAVMGTGLFTDYKMYKVLTQDDEVSVSYSVQCFAWNIEAVLKYLHEFAPQLTELHREKFKDKHVAFNTLLEEV